MQKLIVTIQTIRQKLPALRRQGLKETPTRTIIIDPLLEALGWDVRDPEEVELEYPTLDGKSVDYALKLNNKPVLLVEAKALGDPLEDVKAITQVVGYAANNGIAWCILTNGVVWRVYHSMEPCAAPEKLMFEVNIEPPASEAISVEQVAKLMWRFSREEMARGTLDALGEQVFTDGKVRKALAKLMITPPNKFVRLLRDTIGDDKLSPNRIRESLKRIYEQWMLVGEAVAAPKTEVVELGGLIQSSVADQVSRKRKPKGGGACYDETHHLSQKSQETVSLYRRLERYCLSLEPAGVTRRYLKKVVNFEWNERCFCCVHVLQSGLRVWVRPRLKDIPNPPPFVRDVTNVGHWGVGDTELRITSASELDEAERIIRQSFEVVRKSSWSHSQ